MKRFSACLFFFLGCLALPMVGAEVEANRGFAAQIIVSVFFALVCVSSIFMAVKLSD